MSRICTSRFRTLLDTARKSFSSYYCVAQARRLSSFTTTTTSDHLHHRRVYSSSVNAAAKPTSSFCSNLSLRTLKTTSPGDIDDSTEDDRFEYENGEIIDEWEEEDEVEPQLGDGGDGGGVVLQGVPWGGRALSIAEEVLLQFADDIKLYSFKTTPRGYVYVRLDKLSNLYGCPAIEEIEGFSQEYKKRLDEAGELGEIPDLALEVSSPGAERLLKIPDDLPRFKDMPMRVCYEEDAQSTCPQKNGIFMLECVEEETESCVWKLANVKENRNPQSKGRPLSRKQKDWRLKLPYAMHKRVNLYLEY